MQVGRMPDGMPGVKWFVGVAGSDQGGSRCSPERDAAAERRTGAGFGNSMDLRPQELWTRLAEKLALFSKGRRIGGFAAPPVRLRICGAVGIDDLVIRLA